jgi:hypothetical protein
MAVAFIERIEATLNIQFPLAALFLDGQLSAVIAQCEQQRASMCDR